MSYDHDYDSCGCGCGGHASRDWAAAPGSQIVYLCLGLDKAAICAAIAAGAYTLPLLKIITGAGRGHDCASKHPLGRSCEANLAELLHLYAQPPAERPLGGGCGH